MKDVGREAPTGSKLAPGHVLAWVGGVLPLIGSSHHSPLELLKFLKLLFSRREKREPCPTLAARCSLLAGRRAQGSAAPMSWTSPTGSRAVTHACAETLRKSELAEVLAKIRVAVTAYGITSEDLFGGKSTKTPKPVAATKPAFKSKSKSGLTANFGDGAGNSWVGRGPRPVWLREALGRGKELSDFALNESLTAALAVTSSSQALKKVADKTNGKAAKKQVAVRDGLNNAQQHMQVR